MRGGDVAGGRASHPGEVALRLVSIAELGRRALTGARLEDLMAQAAADSARLLASERAAVLVAAVDELRCEASQGWPREEVRPVPLAARSHLAHVWRAREPAVVLDFASDERFVDSRHLAALGLTSSVAVPIRGSSERALGVLAVHSSRRLEFGDDAVVLLRSLANVLAAASGRERAEAASRRTQAQLRLLAEASDALAGSLDYRRTLRRFADLAVRGFAERCTVELELGGERQEVTTVSAKSRDTGRERASQAAKRARAGRGDERLGSGSEVASPAAGAGDRLVVPLLARERELGLVSFERRAPFDDDDVVFGRELVRRAAIALDNAMLHEGAVRAAEQVRRTQRATAELAEATTPQEIAEVIVSSGAASVGASAAWVAELSADGRSLELLASLGYDDRRVREYESIPLDDHNPTTDALARCEALFLRSAVEFRSTYPQVPYTRFEAMAVVPVLVGADPSGVLALNFAAPHTFDEEERLLLDSLAKLYGQSLERAKLYDASRQRERAAFVLARLGEALDRATGVAHRARRATAVLVEEFAGLAAIYLMDQGSELERVAASERARDWSADSRRQARELARRALITGKAQSSSTAGTAGPHLVLRALPLRARGRAIGTLVLGLVSHRSAGGLDEPGWLAEVAGRTALALDNAMLYEREHGASQTLQLGLLGGALPELPGLSLEVAYRPGTVANDVGGDWYDAFALPGGPLALVVGDVVGHDLQAAIAMGQLKAAVRALAPLGDPGQLMQRLDGFVELLAGAQMATLAYVEVDAERRRLRYSCAGHPPPLLLAADGTPRWLWEGRSPPLGAGGARPGLAEAAIDPGETILLYTDGLVERRGESIEVGLARLLEAVASGHREPLAALRERLLGALLDRSPQEDDVCLVLCRVGGDGQGSDPSA